MARRRFSQKNEQTNLFCKLFCFSPQTKQICLFVFWENLRRANPAFGFIWPLVHSIFNFLPCFRFSTKFLFLNLPLLDKSKHVLFPCLALIICTYTLSFWKNSNSRVSESQELKRNLNIEIVSSYVGKFVNTLQD